MLYDDAEAFLAAVVRGTETADPARIMAARTLIGYQKARSRRPVADTVTPRERQRIQAMEQDRGARLAWEEKAAAIRKKHRA